VDQIVTSATEGLTRPTASVTLSKAEDPANATLLFPDPSFVREVEQPFAHSELPRTKKPGALASRALDIVFALGLIIATLPLMLFCALAVRLSGPGPVIFSQKRIGRFGDEFSCLKFRTMVQNAELAMPAVLEASSAAGFEWSATQKLTNDPRVTSVGRFLRRYCLDELPQLLNVLAGQMSIVGPRPIVAAEVVRYGPFFIDYCSVKPGLTGLWQVSGKHLLPYQDRVRLDAAYANSKSVRTDLAILCRTVPFVLAGKNV